MITLMWRPIADLSLRLFVLARTFLGFLEAPDLHKPPGFLKDMILVDPQGGPFTPSPWIFPPPPLSSLGWLQTGSNYDSVTRKSHPWSLAYYDTFNTSTAVIAYAANEEKKRFMADAPLS